MFQDYVTRQRNDLRRMTKTNGNVSTRIDPHFSYVIIDVKTTEICQYVAEKNSRKTYHCVGEIQAQVFHKYLDQLLWKIKQSTMKYQSKVFEIYHQANNCN